MSEAKDTRSQQNKSSESEEHDIDQVVDSVKRLPPKKQQQAIAKLEMYSGPIPHPDILKKYDEIDPGAAKQIIDNGVEESMHRRKMETDMLEAAKKDRRRRDWMGFVIGIIALATGTFLMYMDHVVTGTIFSGVSVIGLVSLFLANDNSSGKNEHGNSNSDTSEKE